MIYVTRLNHTTLLLNSDLIEYVETTPDTVISLTTGEKLLVLESPQQIADRARQYRRSILAGYETTMNPSAPRGNDKHGRV